MQALDNIRVLDFTVPAAPAFGGVDLRVFEPRAASTDA
jgi:hypothetical protein